jgi:hypothetical protein
MRTTRGAIAQGLGDRDTAAIMFQREKELGIQVRHAEPTPVRKAA